MRSAFAGRVVALVFATALAAGWLGVARGAEDEPGRRTDVAVSVAWTGDVFVTATVAFGEVDFERTRRRDPDGARLASATVGLRPDVEPAQAPTVRWDAAGRAAVVEARLLGAVRSAPDGRLELPVARTLDFVAETDDEAGRTLHFYDVRSSGRGPVRFRFPRVARDLRFDPAGRVIRFTLPSAPANDEGTESLVVRNVARGAIVTTSKTGYALASTRPGRWLARSVVRSTGTTAARDVRLRWRVVGATGWTPWDDVGVLAPGRSAVRVAYAPLDDRAGGGGPRSVPLLVECEWTGADGARHADASSITTTALPVGGWVATEDADLRALLAAWVPRTDAAVAAVLAAARATADDAGAGADDGLGSLRSVWFTLAQHGLSAAAEDAGPATTAPVRVRFPRETLADRRGTRLELALLWAAIGHAAGMAPFLCWVDGEPLPAFALRGGRRVALRIERDDPQASVVRLFEDLVGEGTALVERAAAEGTLAEVDVRAEWAAGLEGPDLPAPSREALTGWADAGPGEPPADGDPVGPRPPTPPRGTPPPTETASDRWAGEWTGTMPMHTKGTDVVFTWDASLTVRSQGDGRYAATFRARGQLVVAREGVVEAAVDEEFQGRASGAELRLRGEKMVLTIVASGRKTVLAGDELVARRDGEELVVTLAGDEMRLTRR